MVPRVESWATPCGFGNHVEGFYRRRSEASLIRAAKTAQIMSGV